MDINVLPNEEWRDVPGYDGRYQVSNLGRMYSSLRARLMSPSAGAAGYFTIGLSHPTKGKNTHSVHVLVMLAFVGKRPYKYVVDHVDGNEHNNVLTNLEYITQAENQRRKEARRLALGIAGRRLTLAQQQEVQAEKRAGTLNAAAYARKWDFDHATIRRAAAKTHYQLAV
jgi:hypothetical protein